MNRIAVFCGSSMGNDAVYKNETIRLGEILAKKNIELIYGGADVGLMGILADSVLQNGGKVTGIIPAFIQDKEIAHCGLTQLITVDTMHRRKEEMERLCNGVIALPGGFGTLDEFFEILTWGQLGLHQKPAAIFNVNGYYDYLLNFSETMVREGFLKETNRQMMIVSDSPEELLQKMTNYSPPHVSKWIQNDDNIKRL